MKHIFFLVLLIAGGYYYWTTRPVTYGPGVVAPTPPQQKQAFGEKDITYEGYTITPLADFDVQARVLSKKRYYEDPKSDLMPYDIVIGWGPMSDERNLDKVLIKQSKRSFFWEMTNFPIPQRKMFSHTAIMHLIPTNDEIRSKIGDVRQGNIISLKGFLVKVTSPKGWTMKSSLSRDDIGDKSGEVVWVKDFDIL